MPERPEPYAASASGWRLRLGTSRLQFVQGVWAYPASIRLARTIRLPILGVASMRWVNPELPSGGSVERRGIRDQGLATLP